MSDTPETDAAEWRDEMCDPPNVVESDFARRLERQRDAYAETLREILAMDPDWTVIARRHPELGNAEVSDRRS